MGESVTDVPCFEQSVSFGRFESDTLSWERWSTFPTNKYLEEVEKCSTPGSVAQKKAYFEAHYKKIAARRAELLLDQERIREAELDHYENSAAASLICDASEQELDLEKVDTYNSVSETYLPENEVVSFDGEVSVEHVHLKSNSDDVFNQENEVGGFDGEVSDDHVDVHVKSDELSGYDDAIPTVNDTSELSNVISEMCEDIDEFMDDGSTIDEGSSEVVKVEVTENIPELKYCADVICEVVKSELTERIDSPNDGVDMINGNNNWAQKLASKLPEMVNRKEPGSVTEDLPSTVESKGEELPQEKVKRTIVEEVSGEVMNLANSKTKQKVFPQEKVKQTIVEEERGNLMKLANSKTKQKVLPQEKVKQTNEETRNLMKLANSKTVQKAMLVKKTSSTTDTKKKPVPVSPVSKRNTAPMQKSPMLSTPKSSKPEPTKVSNSASRLLNKKENGFTPPTIKKTVGPQSKRVVPTSLHMSLNFGTTNADQSMRKSLIMERMGDKDIVKRAFKAFQNTPQMPPSSLIKSPTTMQSVPRKVENKAPPANTLLKKNDGIRKVGKTAGTRTGEQGTRKTLLTPGVNMNSGTDQRNVKTVAASFGPRVQLHGNSRKEDSMKSELKARTNVFEETNLQSKLKVEKAAQVKKLSQSMNSKPKFPSTNNRRHGGSVLKEDGKAQVTG